MFPGGRYVGNSERQWRNGISRREALAGLASFLAASPVLRAQQDPFPLTTRRRMPGFGEMTTAYDFEPVFRANVSRAVYDYTAGAPISNSRCAATGMRSTGLSWTVDARSSPPRGRRHDRSDRFGVRARTAQPTPEWLPS